MLFYSIVFIIVLFVAIRSNAYFHVQGISKWIMPLAFLFKIGVGLLLFFVHIQTYGIDDLSHDGETFMKEGKFVNDVFFHSPLHYFQLLTGIGESQSLIDQYLQMTEYWSAGDLTLINDSKNVIRVHSIIHFFSANSVLIHLACFCLLSLIALRNFYIAIFPYTLQQNKTVFFSLLLIPSTVFWTSSMLKEPLVFLGLSFFVLGLLNGQKSLKRILNIIGGIVLLLMFKPYILLCLIPALVFYVLYRYVFQFKWLPTIASGVFLLILFSYSFKNQRNLIVHYLTRKQFDFVNVGKGGLHVIGDTCFYYFQPHQYENLKIEKGIVTLIKPSNAFIAKFGSTQRPIPVKLNPEGKGWPIQYFTPGCNSFIETTPIANDFTQLIINIPEALVNSMFRPFINDPGSSLKYLSFVEIWLITIILVMAFFYRRSMDDPTKALVFSLVIFAVVLAMLIGWTTPVLGALVRYRFPAQFAMLIVALIILKPLKKNKWRNTSL